MSTEGLSFADFDDPPQANVLAVETGLDLSNCAVAPVSDVRSLASFASNPAGQVVGGAVGRTWGRCCELLSFQAPEFYRKRGYSSIAEVSGYPDGITKYLMHKKSES